MTKANRFLIYLTTTLLFSGCAYTPITVPELPALPPQKAAVCPELKPVVCPRLDMPEPIPKNLGIELRDGKIVNVDAGGEQLIRNYAATRKAVKALWPD